MVKNWTNCLKFQKKMKFLKKFNTYITCKNVYKKKIDKNQRMLRK